MMKSSESTPARSCAAARGTTVRMPPWKPLPKPTPLTTVPAKNRAGDFTVSGVGFGSGFQGGIRTVVPRAAAHERAGVLSLLFIISYLGLGLPAVAAGFRIVHGGGLVGTARDYGAAVVLLALIAAGGLLRTGRSVQS